MMLKATLIKGKTFNLGKYRFDSDDLKSQIIPDEFALLLAKNEKFKIEAIEELEIIKPEGMFNTVNYKSDSAGCGFIRIILPNESMNS